jgi:hypothetical protein
VIFEAGYVSQQLAYSVRSGRTIDSFGEVIPNSESVARTLDRRPHGLQILYNLNIGKRFVHLLDFLFDPHLNIVKTLFGNCYDFFALALPVLFRLLRGLAHVIRGENRIPLGETRGQTGRFRDVP